MMKIGCCAYSYRDYITTGKMTLEGFIEEAHKIRLDGVELTGYYFTSTERKYLHNLKRLCLEKGLSISMASCGAHLFNPKEETEKNIEEIKRWLEVAYELGAPCLRVFGGRWPTPNYTKEEAIKIAIETGKACVRYAEDLGVVIALENHGGITRLADDVVKIIEGVNSDWFKLNLDTGNYPDNLYVDMEKSAPYTVHVHAKVESRTEKGPIKLDYTKIRQILEGVGYNGWISIEFEVENQDPVGEVPKFAEYLQRVFSGIS